MTIFIDKICQQQWWWSTIRRKLDILLLKNKNMNIHCSRSRQKIPRIKFIKINWPIKIQYQELVANILSS